MSRLHEVYIAYFFSESTKNFNCIRHWNLYTELNFGSCWQQDFHNPNEISQRTRGIL